MAIKEDIKLIKADADSKDIFIYEYNRLFTSRYVIFLDTCFIAKMHHFSSLSAFYAMLKKYTDNKKDDVVFVITGLMLYELKDSKDAKLQKKNEESLLDIKAEGYDIICLEEEVICDIVGNYVARENIEWNNFFVKLLSDNKANLSTICGILHSDTSLKYIRILARSFEVPDSDSFIADMIEGVKNRKASKDSLAEEMVMLCALFLLEMPGKSRIYFCTDDYAAIAKLNKVVRTSCRNTKRFKQTNIFYLVQSMCKEGFFTETDKKMLKVVLNKIFNKAFVVIEEGDIFVSPTETEVTVEEAVDKMLDINAPRMILKYTQ